MSEAPKPGGHRKPDPERGTHMIIDIHHDGRIESHPYRIRERTADGWALVLNFAGQPRKFRTMQEATDWAKQRQDYGTSLNGWSCFALGPEMEG